jgi:predicted transcriptional regulator with HTH domain
VLTPVLGLIKSISIKGFKQVNIKRCKRGSNMTEDFTQKIEDYLKQIYPKSATKSEIFKAVGIESCCGGTSLDTLVVRRKIAVSGKKGSSNLYCYKK